MIDSESFNESDYTKASTTTDEYELCVHGYKCPDEYVNLFTPMEFEEVNKKFRLKM